MSRRSRRSRGDEVARWDLPRRDGTQVAMRATATGRRLVVARRHGRRWTTTRVVDADPKTIAKLRRQGRGS